MHVGKQQGKCPVLKVHGSIINDVTEISYLGDILSCYGKNVKNIKSRVSKRIGIISNIISILESVCFGPHYLEIAMLLRDSMLINGTIYNAEVWYNITSTEMKELEDLENHITLNLGHYQSQFQSKLEVSNIYITFYAETNVKCCTIFS